MAIVMLLLAVVYLAFIAVLFYLRVNVLFIGIFVGGLALVQYFFSDKLCSRVYGRGPSLPPQQAPELHGIVERLSQLMDLPKPRFAHCRYRRPQRVRHWTQS